MEVTDMVRKALEEMAQKEDMPWTQVEHALSLPAHHPNDWVFNLFDTDQTGFIYPETVMRILTHFGLYINESRMIDIIRLISGQEDTPIDYNLFDKILAFCREICASFHFYW